MRTIKNKISALVLGVCLLVSLALGGVVAFAANSMNNGTLKVTVSKSTDPTFVTDLQAATVVIDLYKIADATPNAKYDVYDYTYINGLTPTTTSTGEIDWEKLAEDAKALVANTSIQKKTLTKSAGAMDVTFTGLDDGLYLVDAHGDTEFTDAHGLKSRMARSPYYMYNFKPYVTALPTKDADGNGVIMTSYDYGEWKNGSDGVAIEVGLKPSRLPRYGALKIYKKIDGDASDEESTFVFHIWGKTVQGQDYDNYASVTIPAGELTGEKIVDHIPAGTNINIEEVYTAGERYKLKSLNPKTGTIVADDNDNDTGYRLIEFTCVNEPDTETYGDHGVENNFRYKTDNERWNHEADPEEKVVDKDDLIKQ